MQPLDFPHSPHSQGPAEDRSARARGANPLAETSLWLLALRRRWLLAGVLGLVGAAVGALVAWDAQSPARYAARALLHVAAAQPQVIFTTGEPRADFATYRQSQLAFVKSRLVLTSALRDPKVACLPAVVARQDPVQWLEKELKADYQPGPEIMRVSLKGNDPDELTILVNAVVHAYLREVVDKEHQNRRARLNQLQELHRSYERDLACKREESTRLARQAGTNDARVLAIKQELALKRLHQAQQELLRHQADVRRLEVELATVQARAQTLEQQPIPEAALQEALGKDPVILRYREEIAALESRLDDIARVATRGQGDPAYLNTLKDLQAARTALAARTEKLLPILGEQYSKGLRAQLQADLAQRREQLVTVREHERVAQSLVERLSQEPRTINESSLNLESLRREIAQAEDLVRKMAAEMETIKVELHAPPRVTQLEEAMVTATNEEQRRLVLTVLAGIGSLVLVVFGLVRWEICNRRLGTSEEVVQDVGLQLLGVLPARPRQLATEPVTEGRGYSTNCWNEAVHTTLTVLLHQIEQKGQRVLQVVSATAGEGKTTLVVALASSLARNGHRTLLIDGDLFRPVLHDQFRVPQAPGLGELLRGAATEDRVVLPTPVPGLALLPAGLFKGPSARLLSRSGLATLLKHFKEQYDYVLIDSSPLLSAAAPLLFAQQVDGVIVSVRRDVSRLTLVTTACQRLAAIGVPILGAVFQGMPSTGHGYRYSYGAKATTAN